MLAAQRAGDSWRTITYGAARRQVDGLAQALLDEALPDEALPDEAGAGPNAGASSTARTGRPVLILSGNSIEHLLLTLACYTIGSPVVPVSIAYSLLATDYAKLRAMADVVGPAVVFADDGDAYAGALEAVSAGRAVITSSGRTARGHLGCFDELAATAPTGRVEERFAAVGPDTVAKILFTSGSTGHPKGVINTHRMLCANQQMIRQVWPFLADEPPVLLDWLPWSYPFGGNHNLHQVIANAGSLWIDGRPAPGTIERTVRNLADVSPTIYYSVAAGYGALLPFLQADTELARRFFARLRIAFFAAAALPQQLWDAIGALAAATGSAAPITTSWGATETAPAAASAHFAGGRADCIGVPLPGVTVKLAPVAERMEIRVQGPTVTPDYLGAPDQTQAAFDAEGFYLTGDAVQLVDGGAPNAGLRFDGRIAADFKLATGTWVRVGTLRVALLSAAEGLFQDVVLTGRDAGFIGALGCQGPEIIQPVQPAGQLSGGRP
jgi:feruloyl-CoA synthase